MCPLVIQQDFLPGSNDRTDIDKVFVQYLPIPDRIVAILCAHIAWDEGSIPSRGWEWRRGHDMKRRLPIFD